MKFSASSAAVAALVANAAAQTVSGAAEGFASGVTGGGVSFVMYRIVLTLANSPTVCRSCHSDYQ
jgi:nitrate/TMAO reductase-like tetraheme cytochrome c subunit